MRNNRKQRDTHDKFFLGIKIFTGVVVVAVIGGGIAAGVLASSNQVNETCTVEEKDRSTVDGASSYRVYTDCGVYTVEDNLLFGQWNSADTYSGLKVGETYELRTVGFRNGFLSIFPNILEATPVS